LGAGDQKKSHAHIEVAGVKMVSQQVSDVDKDSLRTVSDQIKSRLGSGIVVLAAPIDGNVHVVVAVTPDLTARIKAGQIVKEIAPIVGGKGGGRPDFAEAGGKHPERIDEMLDTSRRVVESLLTKP
jgi:alanyl-tRNA synthetase